MTNDYKSNNKPEDMKIMLNIASFSEYKLLMTILVEADCAVPDCTSDYHWWYPVLNFMQNLIQCAYPGSSPAMPLRDINTQLMPGVWATPNIADMMLSYRITDFVNWYNRVSELPRETKFIVNIIHDSDEMPIWENYVPIMIDFSKEIVDLSNSGIFTYLGETRDPISDDSDEATDVVLSNYNLDYIQFYDLYDVIEEVCTMEDIGPDMEMIFRNGKRVKLNNTVPDSDTTTETTEMTKDMVSYITARINDEFKAEDMKSDERNEE